MWVGDTVEIGGRKRARIRSVHLEEGKASYAVERRSARITRYEAILLEAAPEPFRAARFTFADGGRLDLRVTRATEQEILKTLAWVLMDYQGRAPAGTKAGVAFNLRLNGASVSPGFAGALSLVMDQIGEGDDARPFSMILS